MAAMGDGKMVLLKNKKIKKWKLCQGELIMSLVIYRLLTKLYMHTMGYQELAD